MWNIGILNTTLMNLFGHSTKSNCLGAIDNEPEFI